jgi:Dyp-type peroxidase family
MPALAGAFWGPTVTALDYADIQGLVLRGYGEKPEASFLLGQVRNARAVRHWLAHQPVTNAALAHRTDGDRDELRRQRHAERSARNVAFTYAGLLALGLDAERGARAFADEYRAGMAHGRTRQRLGDELAEQWAWADRAHAGGAFEADLVVLLYAPTAADLAAQMQRTRDELGPAVYWRVLDTQWLHGREHFGFLDGIGQPRLRVNPNWRDTAAGEIVLGYPDSRGDRSPPEHDDLLANGSFLVFRQFYQDVPAFWRAAAAVGGGPPGVAESAVKLAAKMVGRWPSGAPLVVSPEVDPGPTRSRVDRFGYRDHDPDGLACPFGAHLRRMNPRDWLFGATEATARLVSERHRIVRRARPYGPPTNMTAAEMARDPAAVEPADRGLHFLCFASDIARQFEFLQQSWANNPKFAGLLSDPDPLIGRAERRDFTIQARPVRLRARALPEFVRVDGGGYFFLPGITALRRLAGAANG